MASEGGGYIRGKYQEGVQELRQCLRSYWLNHSFLLGHQWTYWDLDNRRIDTVTTEGDRIQATVNRTRSNMRTIMGNLTQRALAFENVPKASDDDSIRSSAIGENVVKDTARAHYWDELKEMFVYAMFKGGTAAISVDWDPDNNETVENLLTIGEFIVEPGATSARKARWWIRRQALPTDEVWSMFTDHFGDKRPAPDSVSSFDPYMHRIVGDILSYGSEQVDRTHVYTYYERPNPLCPEGKVLVEVNGDIIQHIDKWPYPFKDRLNLVPGCDTPVEGRWYGSTFMDDVRPLQVALNAAWSNLLEHLRNAGNARLVVPSSGVDLINHLTDMPGEMLEYPDSSAPPEYMTPAQLSAWLRDMPDMLAMAIDDAMSVHEVSRGDAPGQIESGLGVQILTENDSSPTGRAIRTIATVFGEVATMVLELVADNVKERRETVVLDGSSPTRYEWTGSDIKGHINVSVPVEQIVPINRAALQAEATKLLEMGLIETIADYVAISQAPNAREIVSVVDPDRAKARRENAAFSNQEVPIPATFDDHETHIIEHNNFRKTKAYEILDDESKEIVDLHVDAHESMQADAIGEQEEMAEESMALAAAPTADGAPAADPALLGQDAMMPPEGMDMPLPEEEEEEVPDPMGIVNDMMLSLEEPETP